MTPIQPTKNSTPYLPEDYDAKISDVIPYYLSFNQEIINLVKIAVIKPESVDGYWMRNRVLSQ